MSRVYWEPPKPGQYRWIDDNGEAVFWEGGDKLAVEKLHGSLASGFRLTVVKVGTNWWHWHVEKAADLKPTPIDMEIARGYGTGLEDAKHRAEAAVAECWAIEAASRAVDGWPPSYQTPDPCVACQVTCKRHEATCGTCPLVKRT